MRRLLWIAAAAALAACQAPPPSAPASPPAVDAAPSTRPPATASAAAAPASPAAPAAPDAAVAAWETSYPFSLATVVERRLRRPLAAGDRRRIDVIAAHALAGERGALHRWSDADQARRGIVRLVRRIVAGDGRVCARLHHEHRLGRRAIFGSVRICRERGDAAAPWSVDEIRWMRIDNDVARAGEVGPTRPGPAALSGARS